MNNLKDKINKLLLEGDKIRDSEGSYNRIWGATIISGPKTDKWLNDIKIFADKLPLNHPLKDEINKVYSHKKSPKTFGEMYGLLESLRDDESLEDNVMYEFKIVSPEAEKLLIEILEHEDDYTYWEKRFKEYSHKEDVIARGCFKELSDNGLVKILFADNHPYDIQILKDGYLYKEHLKNNAINSFSTKQTQTLSVKSKMEYDVFISHASKDKEEFVEELKESIKMLGVKFFYDEESIEWGDKWKELIIEGTNKSEFAIIVISENFFDREWTEKELSEFLNRQNDNGQKLILPIIHNITKEQLKEKYPDVADIQVIDSKEHTYDQIALLFARQLIKRYKGIK